MGEMEPKYFLSEDDVRHLSDEQRKNYNIFFRAILDSGIVYEAYLEDFDNILQQQYRSGVLYKPNDRERYLEILAKNINSIIDAIIKFRNDAINDKRSFSKYGFEEINKGLDVLKRFVNNKLQNPHYLNSYGYQDLKSVLPRIDQLKSQISQDISFYQGYSDEKTSVIADFLSKKQAYDSLSLFGKLAARINGKKKELKEAEQKKTYYTTIKISTEPQQPGDIVNPSQYDDYIKRQQPDQSTGGMSR